MKNIRGGRGLGDSLYVLGVARYFVERGELVNVFSDHAPIFADLGVPVVPFERARVDVVAHYIAGKTDHTTNMWQDVCKSAGVAAEFKAAWVVKNNALIGHLRELAAGRPIVLVIGGRAPMDRKDGFGQELLPSRDGFCCALSALSDCFTVQVGKADQIYDLPCDLNLNGKTTLEDLMDLAVSCDGVVGQCSFAVPLAEIFDKPFLLIWSARVEASREHFIRVMTPKKVMSGRKDSYVMDDWTDEQIQEAARAFRSVF